jgi:hypothetical protein
MKGFAFDITHTFANKRYRNAFKRVYDSHGFDHSAGWDFVAGQCQREIIEICSAIAEKLCTVPLIQGR